MQQGIIQCPSCGANLQLQGISPGQVVAPCPYCQCSVPLLQRVKVGSSSPQAAGFPPKESETNWVAFGIGASCVVGLALCLIGVAILARLDSSPPPRPPGEEAGHETVQQPVAHAGLEADIPVEADVDADDQVSAPSTVVARPAQPAVVPIASTSVDRPAPLPFEDLPVPDPKDYEFFDEASRAIDPPDLRYFWEPGQPYAFRFTFSATMEDRVIQLSGMNVFTPRPLNSVGASETIAGVSQTAEGSGTGFVVSSNGYLVTCAHVVEGATKIEVEIGGGAYKATVLVMDRENDVALLHIPATGLPVLPLADSAQVELAQEVRAIGFPLSTLLGNSVKVTRGSIAGILNNDDGNLFQVDSSINPGNSGGPLVNERGEVVGVATAKLTGADVSNVGFCVPSNMVKQLLRVKKISYTRRGALVDLDGPDLARRVTPAVALLSVTIAPGGVGMAKPTTLDFSGYTTGGSRPIGSESDSSVSTSDLTTEKVAGQIILDEYGEIVSVSQNAGLGASGAMGQSMFIGLSSTGRSQWETKRSMLVPELVDDAPVDSLGYRGRNYHLHRRGPTPRAVMHPATERIVRAVTETLGDQVVIQTLHAVTTLQRPAQTPFFELEGKGTTTFDKSLGMPVAMEYEATLTRQVEGRNVRTPVKMTYTMVDVADATRAIASAQATGGSINWSGSDTAMAVSASTLDEIIVALRTTEIASVSLHRDKLAELLSHLQVPESRRAEIAELLSSIVARESRHRVSDGVALAVAKWGSDEDAIALANRIGAVDASMRQVLIKRLRDIDTSDSARVLAAIVGFYHDSNATAALKAMGPTAEDAAIFLLNDPDIVDRMEGCRILGEVGGKPGVAALSKLLRTEDNELGKDAARAALRKIRLRPDAAG